MRKIRFISVVLAISAGLLLCSCNNSNNDKSTSVHTEVESYKPAEGVTVREIKPEEYKKSGNISLAPFDAISLKAISISDEEVTVKVMELISAYPGIAGDDTVKTAELYDCANFDYTGYIDGKTFEGGSAKNTELLLGSNKYIPGFESQMVGMKVGETKDIHTKFPADYKMADLAGKDVKFVVTLNSLKRYSITDKNVQTLSGINDMTAEKYRAYMKEELRLNTLINTYFKDYINICKFGALDQNEINEKMESKRDADEYYSSLYGLTIQEYTGYADEAYEKYIKDYATLIVKQEIAYEALIKVYNLKLSADEKQLALSKYAAEVGVNAETFKTYYKEETINKVLNNDMAMKYVVSRFTFE